MRHFPKIGLYAITAEDHSTPEKLAEAVAEALRGGAKAIQYRAKFSANRLEEARLIAAKCRAFGVPLIVNDDVELALAVEADGVHLGKDDASMQKARERLGGEAIVGVSCYDSVERALEAEARGASYVAFGRFFPSRSKPLAPCARLETLTEARRKIKIPIVAIGGITPENGGVLVQAGADILAVIDGIFGKDDPQAAASGYAACFVGNSGTDSAIS